jgi:glycosyltransferase involved in cell wall biosynthesis
MVSAAWQRFAVTRLALAQRAHLCDALAAQGHDATCVIVADDENLEIAQEYGFATCEQSNDALGRKFNDGIEYACGYLDADYVVLIGSDDWLHPDAFQRLPKDACLPEMPTVENPAVVGRAVPEMVVGSHIVIVDLASGNARMCVGAGRLGIIPWIMPRKLLRPSGYRPVPEMQRRGIDGSLWRGLGVRPKIVFSDPHWAARIDFKSDTNLNSYKAISDSIGKGEEFHVSWLVDHYPMELVEKTTAWQSQLV